MKPGALFHLGIPRMPFGEDDRANLSSMENSTYANWLASLPERISIDVSSKMFRKCFDDGQYIFRAGEFDSTIYQIIEGSARLTTTSPSGKEVTWAVYVKGGCFGLTQAIDRGPRMHDAFAIGSTALDCLTSNDLDALRRRHPEIDSSLARWTAKRIRELYARHKSEHLYSLEGRLANQVLFLLQFAGPLPDGTARRELAVTHETLAAVVCLTRQSISKILRSWIQGGVLEHRYGLLKVLDLEALRAIARDAEIS